MGFFRDLCDGVIGNCRNCMTTPITRTKIYWFGGISLLVIILIIIICVTVNSGGGGGSAKGSDALKDTIPNTGSLYFVEQYFENTLLKDFPKDNLLKNITDSATKIKFFGIRANCSSKYKDAIGLTLDQIDYVTRLLPINGVAKLATSHSDASKITANGGIAIYLQVNGGHSLDMRLSMLRTYYTLGVRILSVASSGCGTPWAPAANDSSELKDSDNTTWSEFRQAAILEMNRLGIVIDIGSADSKTQIEILDISKAPVVAIGVGLVTVKKDPLNLNDTVAKKMAEKGGLLMLTSDCALFANDTSNCTIEDFKALLEKAKAIKLKVGLGGTLQPNATLPNDFNITTYFNKLYDSGYDMDFLKRFGGENVLELLKSVEKISEGLKKESPQDRLSRNDRNSLNQTCYSDVDAAPPVPPTPKPSPS